MVAKQIQYDILVGTGLSLLGKKIKRRILSISGSGITLPNNEINDIIKVIRSLENRNILLKGTTHFFKAINDCWFTVNEKCTYIIS